MPSHPNQLTGILLVDKPTAWTSHDVIAAIRNQIGERKVGHTGTLDPGATGLLVVLVGRQATRLSARFKNQTKTYNLKLKLGMTTDTLDSDGEITHRIPPDSPQLKSLSPRQFSQIIASFQGSYQQQVPIYSAVKVQGRKLYQIARQSSTQKIDLPSREVTIHHIQLIEYSHPPNDYPQAQLETTVSAGTYTRALVRDIGQKLGIPTVQTELRRTQVGPFRLVQAQRIDQITSSMIIPIHRILPILEKSPNPPKNNNQENEVD